MLLALTIWHKRLLQQACDEWFNRNRLLLFDTAVACQHAVLTLEHGDNLLRQLRRQLQAKQAATAAAVDAPNLAPPAVKLLQKRPQAEKTPPGPVKLLQKKKQGDAPPPGYGDMCSKEEQAV